MLSSPLPAYRRGAFGQLAGRLSEPVRFIQVVAGPRQVGKTTLVRQALAEAARPSHFASADDPGLRDRTWLSTQWQVGRQLAMGQRSKAGDGGAILAIDEVQKIAGWSETVKRLWDEDRSTTTHLQVVLLGSAPLAVQRGLTESLAGRFELIRLMHWSLSEMEAAFGWDLDAYLRFGGYPGSAGLIVDPDRWRAYMLDALIEPTISRDLLLMTRIDKPALLRQLFRLGIDYSGQAVSYTKLVGQLQDAGNTVTVAHYLRLLGDVGLLIGLEKHSGSRVRQRGSSPKLVALDPGLITAMSGPVGDAAVDPTEWGRRVETAVGAHLVNTAGRDVDVTWWREGDREVDYVVSGAGQTLAIEVASGRPKTRLPGLEAFSKAFPGAKTLLIGGQGLPLEEALRSTAPELVGVR
jgi:predicted AAA+ superfamily ATPase